MYLGSEAESLSAPRSSLIAVFNPCSKSTNVSDGQIRFSSSSRVTASPARSRQRQRLVGLRPQLQLYAVLIQLPCLRS
jgi:hypothetical protein